MLLNTAKVSGKIKQGIKKGHTTIGSPKIKFFENKNVGVRHFTCKKVGCFLPKKC